MSYTIENFKDDLQRKIHGQSLNKVPGNIYDIAYEAARDVLAEIDPAETKRLQNLDTPLYDDVYSYSAPADLKGNKIIDIRPQVNRGLEDNFTQTYNEQFDRQKTRLDNYFSVEYQNGTKILRIAKQLTSGILLHKMDSVTANGIWAVGNDATSITTNSLNKVAGTSSIEFDLDGSTTDGYIENSTLEAKDLSDEEDTGAIFVRVYIPDSSIITSFNLRWGDDTSNYWNKTVTAPHDGTSLINGWNRLRFDWSSATKTGSPVASSVNYLRLTVNYDGTAETGILVDDITAQNGEIYESLYYSKYLFKNTSGTWIEKPTADTDVINLDTDSYNIFLRQAATNVAHEIGGEDAGFDITVMEKKLTNSYNQYKKDYKSEVEKPHQKYYSMPRRRGYGGTIGRASNEGL